MSGHLRDSMDDFGRSLFEAADEEAPRPGAEAALLVALVSGVATVGAAATAGGALGAGATGVPLVKAATTWAGTAKWTAIGIALGVCGTVGVQSAMDVPVAPAAPVMGAPSPARVAPSFPSPVEPSPARTPPPLPPPPPERERVAAPESRGSVARAIAVTSAPGVIQDPVPAVELASEAIASKSTLGEEVSRLDDARRHLARDDAKSALAALDEFDVRFAASPLAPEASLLRVEAHLARGERGAASRSRDRLVSLFPESAAARRATELLAPE